MPLSAPGFHIPRPTHSTASLCESVASTSCPSSVCCSQPHTRLTHHFPVPSPLQIHKCRFTLTNPCTVHIPHSRLPRIHSLRLPHSFSVGLKNKDSQCLSSGFERGRSMVNQQFWVRKQHEKSKLSCLCTMIWHQNLILGNFLNAFDYFDPKQQSKLALEQIWAVWE